MEFQILFYNKMSPDHYQTCLKSKMFSIRELLVARPLISPRLMNWKERYSGTREVKHLKAMIAFRKYN